MTDAIQRVADDVATMAFVQSSLLCRNLDEGSVRALIEAGEVVAFGPDAFVYEEGQTLDTLGIILEGKALACRARGDALVELGELTRGSVFGEASVLTQQPFSISVVSVSELLVIRFPGAVVRDVADRDSKLGRRLAALMAARGKDYEKRLLEA